MPEESDIKTELEDEILVKDEDGNFKILRNGELVDLEEKEGDFLIGAKTFTEEDSRKIANFVNKKLELNLNVDLHERLENAVLTYLNGVRDEIETNQVLIKSQDEGGVALERIKAKETIDFLRDKGSIKEKISQQTPEPAQEVPVESDSFLDETDKEEIEKAKEDIKGLDVAPEEDYKFQIERILQKAKFPLDSELTKRLSNIILLRLRVVRDNLGTKMALKRSKDEGGMGFSDEELEKIMSLINEEVEKIEKAEKTKKKKVIAQSKEMYIKEKEAEKERKKKEKKERDVAFEKLTGKKSQDFKIEHKKEVKKPITIKKLQPPPPKIVPAQEKELKYQRPPLEKGKPIIDKKPFKAPTSASNEDKEPVISGGLAHPKPKIEDVKYVPKIIGPIDELKEMTVEDFRKLGEPKVAIAKIHNMLSLLERQSFTKMIEGVKAFKKSNIFKTYLEMGQESILNKKSIEEVMKAREDADRPVLTREELNIIMDFNKQVKY